MYQVVITNNDNTLTGRDVPTVLSLEKDILHAVYLLKCGVARKVQVIFNREVVFEETKESVVGARYLVMSVSEINTLGSLSLAFYSEVKLKDFVSNLKRTNAVAPNTFWYDLTTQQQVAEYIRNKV